MPTDTTPAVGSPKRSLEQRNPAQVDVCKEITTPGDATAATKGGLATGAATKF